MAAVFPRTHPGRETQMISFFFSNYVYSSGTMISSTK